MGKLTWGTEYKILNHNQERREREATLLGVDNKILMGDPAVGGEGGGLALD